MNMVPFRKGLNTAMVLDIRRNRKKTSVDLTKMYFFDVVRRVTANELK